MSYADLVFKNMCLPLVRGDESLDGMWHMDQVKSAPRKRG